MAGNGGHRYCRLDGWLAEKVQTQLGILAVFVEQRAVDRVGLAGSCVRTHRPPGLPCVSKHPRRIEESDQRTEHRFMNCSIIAYVANDDVLDAK